MEKNARKTAEAAKESLEALESRGIRESELSSLRPLAKTLQKVSQKRAKHTR
jgi:hypothetical protein